ncbi:hypothetical protein CVT25_000835 [Psilocybe cyanescens]|uniref:Uncharacterized protein n=1 Tax=Psilocybe cyanescens TaxID=93625 RepID=A0A409XGZ4_PSICY|nr:hypothetical protein CVT25_000835 [Psilocybe cyanescens]
MDELLASLGFFSGYGEEGGEKRNGNGDVRAAKEEWIETLERNGVRYDDENVEWVMAAVL